MMMMMIMIGTQSSEHSEAITVHRPATVTGHIFQACDVGHTKWKSQTQIHRPIRIVLYHRGGWFRVVVTAR